MNTNLNLATKIMAKEVQNDFGDRNFAFSPALIEAMLCMVAAGSKGKTLEQLLSFIGLENADDLHYKPASLEVIGKLTENDSSHVQLSFINAVWVDQRFHLQPSYKEVLNNIYKAEARSADFVNKANEAVAEMNSWSDKVSKGLIKKMVSDGSFNESTYFVLANALYFKGAWLNRYDFPEMLTEKRNFHISNGKTVSVPFMRNITPDSFYGKFDGFAVVQIPYAYKRLDIAKFSMYFILPDEKDGLRGVTENLNADYGLLNQCFKLNREMLIELAIPKFKIKCEFKAMDCMKALGLTLPFMAVEEFTGIVNSKTNKSDAYITDAEQTCYISVDEKGTEAVAILRMRGGGSSEGIPSFVADHPFLFVIREDTSGAILFMGAIINPDKSG